MNKNELLQVLNTLGVRPSRKLGQNFLIDPNMVRAIVRDAELKPEQTVLEVGPGAGVLTRELLQAGCRVVALELDARLVDYLRQQLGNHPNLTLIHGDACRTDYDATLGKRPFRCIANLPYSCSSVFLAKLMRAANIPVDMLLLLQREMADRLAAEPATREYGALSVRVQMRYQVDRIRKVPPQVFHPPPEVESTHVRLTRLEPQYPADIQNAVDTLARLAFQHRRKKAIRTFRNAAPQHALEQIFDNLELDRNCRPEQISPEIFARLAACLMPHALPYFTNSSRSGDST